MVTAIPAVRPRSKLDRPYNVGKIGEPGDKASVQRVLWCMYMCCMTEGWLGGYTELSYQLCINLTSVDVQICMPLSGVTANLLTAAARTRTRN